jgi:hypothetical protein
MPVCFCMLKNMQTHAQAVACCLSIVPCSKTHKHMRNTRWSSILMPVCAFDAQKHKHARHTPKQYLDVCVFFHAQKYTSTRKHTLEQYLDACVFLHTQKHANTRQSTSECPHTIQYAKSDAAGTSSLNFSRIFITSGSKGPKLCIQRHNSTCVRVSCQLWTLNRDAQWRKLGQEQHRDIMRKWNKMFSLGTRGREQEKYSLINPFALSCCHCSAAVLLMLSFLLWSWSTAECKAYAGICPPLKTSWGKQLQAQPSIHVQTCRHSIHCSALHTCQNITVWTHAHTCRGTRKRPMSSSTRLSVLGICRYMQIPAQL